MDAKETFLTETEAEQVKLWSENFHSPRIAVLIALVRRLDALAVEQFKTIHDLKEETNCIAHRCFKHSQVPVQNTNEFSGAECGGCIAEERDSLRSQLSAWQTVAGELNNAQSNYINLLNDELTEVVVIAAVHGWQSKRYDRGVIARDAIKEALSKLNDLKKKEQE